MKEVEQILSQEVEERLQFEALMSELSARFIHVPPHELDGAIEDAQRRLCETLGLDRSALFQRSDEAAEKLLLTHLYQRPGAGGPAVEKRPAHNSSPGSIWVLEDPELAEPYIQLDFSTFFPWTYQQLQKKQTVVMPDVEALPSEAASERERLSRYGTKSGVVVPLFSGSDWLGCLTFATMRERRQWRAPLVKRFEFIAGVFTNALARQRAERALAESRERLALATESAGAGLWCAEIDLNQAWVTPKLRELLRLEPDENLTFERFLRLIHPSDLERVRSVAEEALQTGEELRVDFRIVLTNGSTRWISSHGRRHCDASGKIKRLMGASVDITERKLAEQRLSDSEERFRALVEQAGDGFELLSASGKYLDVNAATLLQLGYTRDEMLNLSVFEIDPSLKHEWFARTCEDLQKRSPLRFESVHRRKDGGTFPVEVTVSSVALGGSTCLVAQVRDITERRLAEQALTKSYEEIKLLKEQLQTERDYLKEEIKLSQPHGEIVGRSPGIKRVLQQVEQVAPANCPVLITGETGTGKELIAQEIHRLSARGERVMVLVNCAALPGALVESELFGRERGAYTGALTAQTGRFEMADGSTIFLDEVGELSMEVQAKLFRVLQEGEFQRLGSPKTYKVDVRVIAATNRDLAADVRKGRFREDLYYRLKVFPIDVPPLRERIGDIPLLVFSFMEELSSRMGKKITKVSRKSMEALQQHHWPGNIRELRNVIEHSVILSSGDMLKLSSLGDSPSRETQAVTLAEVEREHILRTLESTGWRIKGLHGAAKRLDLQPSTLYSRMQKLGIPHRRQKDEMASQG
jgi:PAS domain S-box-containing protein